MSLETARDALTSQSKQWRKRWLTLRRYLLRGAPIYLACVGAVVGLLLYNYFAPLPEPLTTAEVDDIVTDALASATPAPAYSSLVYQTILPSLVFINTRGPGADENNRLAFAGDGLAHTTSLGNARRSERAAADMQLVLQPDGDEDDDSEGNGAENEGGIGSGVVINEAGAILTALHIVERAATIEVTFADGTESTAEIVAVQPDDNIAVLQAEQLPEILVPATLGNPNAMRIGDEAYVVGHPLGLTGSMSAGVISGFNRSFTPVYSQQPLDGLIQFDAAVNSGASGGPLLNRNGQVIGIVVGPLNPAGQQFFIGIGLAVPIDTAGGAADAPDR